MGSRSETEERAAIGCCTKHVDGCKTNPPSEVTRGQGVSVYVSGGPSSKRTWLCKGRKGINVNYKRKLLSHRFRNRWINYSHCPQQNSWVQ